MKPISTFMHGVMDYPMSIILMLSPWMFGFYEFGGAAVVFPMAIGMVTFLQALVTDNETGLVHWLPMQSHNVHDVLAGTFLAVSPWLFGFASVIFAPHVVFGLAMVAAGFLTDSIPYTGRMHHGHHA